MTDQVAAANRLHTLRPPPLHVVCATAMVAGPNGQPLDGMAPHEAFMQQHMLLAAGRPPLPPSLGGFGSDSADQLKKDKGGMLSFFKSKGKGSSEKDARALLQGREGLGPLQRGVSRLAAVPVLLSAATVVPAAGALVTAPAGASVPPSAAGSVPPSTTSSAHVSVIGSVPPSSNGGSSAASSLAGSLANSRRGSDDPVHTGPRSHPATPEKQQLARGVVAAAAVPVTKIGVTMQHLEMGQGPLAKAMAAR